MNVSGSTEDRKSRSSESSESDRAAESLRVEPGLAASANNWGYKPQLDGLRALAVYLVVAFHAGSWRFQGGFIGVDLFFVLSGFLVTNVILTDIAEEGSLRFLRFYSRRARRLIPAATIAIIGTSFAALLVSTPLDRASWVADSRASSLWYANWHFIRQANDYFRADGVESPFLHYWSLSIEEQFYIAFPVVLILLWRIAGRRLALLGASFGALLAVGVLVQLFWANNDPNRAYLGTDARAYQLLVGVVAAIFLWRWRLPGWFQRSAHIQAFVALLALVIAASEWFTANPSERGMVAAFLAIWGVVAIQTARSGVATLFALGPIRYLGQISYGTYLWHWPLVVLTTQTVDASPVALFCISAVGGTALAALSHELVERPIRRSEWLGMRPKRTISFGLVAAAVSGIFIAPALLDSDRKPVVSSAASGPAADLRQPVPDLDWNAAQRDTGPARPPCESPDGDDCIFTEGDGGTMLLIGDSHAVMFMSMFAEIATNNDLTLAIAIEQCPWMEGSSHTDSSGQISVGCIELQERTYDELIPALDPDVIVAAAFPRSFGPDVVVELGTTRETLAALETPELIRVLAEETVSEWRGDGRKVVLIEPTPIFVPGNDPLTCLSVAAFVDECTYPPLLSEVEEEVYRDLAAADDYTISVDLDGFACPRLPICDPLQRDYPVWRDDDHLTATFAASLAPIVEQLLVDSGILS